MSWSKMYLLDIVLHSHLALHGVFWFSLRVGTTFMRSSSSPPFPPAIEGSILLQNDAFRVTCFFLRKTVFLSLPHGMALFCYEY
jgi:hypothetical protein